MEKNEGFQESATSSKTMKKIKFFNLGKKNDWKTLLDKKLIKKIESCFKNEMNELGYLQLLKVIIIYLIKSQNRGVAQPGSASGLGASRPG